jgi:hypothetical protein
MTLVNPSLARRWRIISAHTPWPIGSAFCASIPSLFKARRCSARSRRH